MFLRCIASPTWGWNSNADPGDRDMPALLSRDLERVAAGRDLGNVGEAGLKDTATKAATAPERRPFHWRGRRADGIRNLELVANEKLLEPQLLLGRKVVRQVVGRHAECLQRPTSHGHRRHPPQTVSLCADDGPVGRQHDADPSLEFQRLGELRIAESREIGILERDLRDDERKPSAAPGSIRNTCAVWFPMLTVADFPPQGFTDHLRFEGNRYPLRLIGHWR